MSCKVWILLLIKQVYKRKTYVGRDMNPYFEHKKMNPNFNLFTGSIGFILAEQEGFVRSEATE